LFTPMCICYQAV